VLKKAQGFEEEDSKEEKILPSSVSGWQRIVAQVFDGDCI